MVQQPTEVAHDSDRITMPDSGFSGGLIKAKVVGAIETVLRAAQKADEQLDRLLEDVRRSSSSEPPPRAERPNGRYRGRAETNA